MHFSQRKWIFWSTMLFLTLSSYAVYDYYSKLSTTLHSTEKPLCDLSPPYKSVRVASYMDGGSIEVFVEDHQGHIAELFIPYDYTIHGFRNVHRGNANDGKWANNQLTDSKTALEDIKTILRSDSSDEYAKKCLRSIEFKTGASRAFFDAAMKIRDFF